MNRVNPLRSRTSLQVVTVAVAAAVAGTLSSACQEPTPAGPWGFDERTVRAGKGGKGGGSADPVVSKVEPDTAVQGTTVDLTIHGDNFEPGSVADWLVDGVPTTEVTTNSTTFVNKKRLVANVTVADEAPPVFYDARVTTPPGRRGIGSESLEVKQKGPPSLDASLEVRLTPGLDLSDDDGDPAAVAPYVDGQAGTAATVVGANGQFRISIYKAESTRQFCWDLSNYTSLFPGVTPADLPFDATGFKGCVGGSLFTRDHEFATGLVGMDSNDPALSTMLAGGPFRLDDPENEGWFYLLTFGQQDQNAPDCVQNAPGGTPEGEGFLITMTQGKGDDLTVPRRWTIEPNPARQPGEIDAVLWRFVDQAQKQKGKPKPPECIAVFENFSFKAELIEIGK